MVRLKIQVCTLLKRHSRFYKNEIARKDVCALLTLLQKRCDCKVLKINLKRFEPGREVRKRDFGSEGNESQIVFYAKA